MSDCQHVELKLTADKADDGSPIYYCAAKCGAGLFVAKPLTITASYGASSDEITLRDLVVEFREWAKLSARVGGQEECAAALEKWLDARFGATVRATEVEP
jgi:hypothetical protein